MKFEKIAKLAAELSKSPPGSASFLHAYKPARTQVDKKLSKRMWRKYEAMAKEWTEKRLPPRMQQRYVYGNDSCRLEANFFALV